MGSVVWQALKVGIVGVVAAIALGYPLPLPGVAIISGPRSAASVHYNWPKGRSIVLVSVCPGERLPDVPDGYADLGVCRPFPDGKWHTYFVNSDGSLVVSNQADVGTTDGFRYSCHQTTDYTSECVLTKVQP